MSRRSTKEYLLRMQEDYLGEWDRRKRGVLLDEARRVTGLSRKYINKILLGLREYRERKGRGKRYTPNAEALLVQTWEGADGPCAKYLKKRAFGLLLKAVSLHNNYFRPCVMLFSKTKRPDGKGWRRVYDNPKATARRALESGALTERGRKRIEEMMATTNGMWFMELIR